jgi:hypothetical protein
VFCLCCNLDLKVVPEHHLYGEQQPPKQIHLKLCIEIMKRKEKYRSETIHSFPL